MFEEDRALTTLFPSKYSHFVSLMCEMDVFVMDQMCKSLWPTTQFSIVRYENPLLKSWYHYVVTDSSGTIYDIQLQYIQERREWLSSMVPKEIYTTNTEKLKLMDNHGFTWQGNHRKLYM